jgi:hypothetical protein
MGSSFAALIFQFMRGQRTISDIIADTTSAIWTHYNSCSCHHQSNQNGNALRKDILIFETCQTAEVQQMGDMSA